MHFLTNITRAISMLCALMVSFSVLFAGEAKVGNVAPEFGGKKFYNAPAQTTPTIASLKGRVVMLDFWATWCGPCVASIPHVIELHEKYNKKGLVVIAHTDNSSQNVDAFIKEKKIPYSISVGDNIGDAYGVNGIPAVFLIDPDGKIAWSGHPAQLEAATIEALLKNVRMAPNPTPSFEKPSANSKVAQIENAIMQSGKVGTGIKMLEKLAKDKDAATAQSAEETLALITTWSADMTKKIDELQQQGDPYQAAELAASIAAGLSGHDDAKPFTTKVSELKKDPAYNIGKEYVKLEAIPEEARSDPRFAKMVETFLKKYTNGFYADQARKLLAKP
jgi:thiol-disulfide isomerase/thioredoxin/flavodoxin